MGKLKELFIKNRIEKLARHKKRKKFHKRNKRKIKRIVLTKSQKIFRNNNFYETIDSSVISIPENFNIIDNPEESLMVLKSINYLFEKTEKDDIKMDYSNCKKLGLESSVLTDLIVLNGLKYRNKTGNQVKLSGNQPTTYAAGEIFWNSGLLKHLNLSKIEDPNVVRLDPFNSVIKDINYSTNKTIEYINDCMRRIGYTLNNKGVSYFNELVGEIIGNAKEHSGIDGDWYISGHFSELSKEEYGKGSLCFISMGNTIYYNLINNCKSEETHKKIVEHLKNHKKLFNNGWNKEASVTVFGLQYRISSETDENNIDRGTGTIKFIDKFSKLGKTYNDEKPRMAILSGNTHILFDGTYNLSEKQTEKGKAQVIAFNKDNDLKKRPDPNYVKVLKNGFPGVIISLEFHLDKKYFDKIKEEQK